MTIRWLAFLGVGCAFLAAAVCVLYAIAAAVFFLRRSRAQAPPAVPQDRPECTAGKFHVIVEGLPRLNADGTEDFTLGEAGTLADELTRLGYPDVEIHSSDGGRCHG